MKKPKPWGIRKTRRFQELLLDWFEQHKRELPWRSHPTPYRVWVSEIMLQQTQVKTVRPYYERFLCRFPDVWTLASSSEGEVVTYWAGLGYYGRARNLHRAARMIVRDFRGEFPETPEHIMQLPGIGRYTAGAILSIAFNRSQPIVDGNVRRVAARLHGICGHLREAFFWEQASAWMVKDRPSEFNQAIMELGALVCAPTIPRCTLCPVASMCAARRLGLQGSIPAPRPVRRTEHVSLAILLIEHRGSVLLSSRLPAAYIPGPWGLPARRLRAGEPPERAALLLARQMRLEVHSLRKAAILRHAITHRRIAAHLFQVRLDGIPSPVTDSRYSWVPEAGISDRLTSSLFRKALKAGG